MRRLVCVALFMFANVMFGALVVGGYVSPAAAGAYFVLALLWTAKLGRYRQSRWHHREMSRR